MTVIFMGTPDLARSCLLALLSEPSIKVITVVTQPDRPRGRDLNLSPPPAKILALQHGVPVLQPARARQPEFIEQLRALRADLIVVAAYGQILPKAVLETPKFGCLNVHASLLPKYRGAAPIQRALLNNESETGVTIMRMDEGMDTGDMLRWRTTRIEPADNGQTLHDRLARMGAELLIQSIPEYVNGQIVPTPQDNSQATYASKISKQEGRIRWNDSALRIWNQVRAFTPWPGAFTFQSGPEQRLLKLWQSRVVERPAGLAGEVLQADKGGLVVGCGEQSLEILVLQRQGKRPLSAAAFLAGSDLTAGSRLE